MSEKIQQVLGAMYRDEITSEQAEARLSQLVTKETLAEFLVDAFNRGWITPFNVGLNSDGYPA